MDVGAFEYFLEHAAIGNLTAGRKKLISEARGVSSPDDFLQRFFDARRLVSVVTVDRANGQYFGNLIGSGFSA